MTIDDRVAQLLCSRLCHDLVGPIGAINAGLELMADLGGEDESAAELMRESAAAATRRINFYRVAFGAGGGKASAEGTLSLGEARDLAVGMFPSDSLTLSWEEGAHEPPAFRARPGKILLLLILLASEALPRGGTVSVHTAVLPEGAGIAVTASGRGARLRPEVQAALEGTAADGDLSARNVHAYFARHLATTEGSAIEIDGDVEDELHLMALFKDGVPT